jgi:hypothetical protein
VINSSKLLADLKGQLRLLQADLKARAEDSSNSWGARLKEEYAEAFRRERTGWSWVDWRDNEVDQASVAWIVSTTFLRFCEDNDLLAGAKIDGLPTAVGWIAGPGDRVQRAEENLTAYFRDNPTNNRRHWLQQGFGVLAAQPAGAALVDPKHNPVWKAEISPESATALIAFWRATNDDGALVHDFTDSNLETRFLGDLYQDLSEHAKKIYALLQTPVFVEEFILDQTLTPAIAEFGLEGLKLIDPSCGSGHFLLGAFERLNQAWLEAAPGLDAKERVRRAMTSIHGVDINPFAVAIARFRLTVAGLKATGEQSLVGVPAMGFHLAIGDSLLGVQGSLAQTFDFDDDEAAETAFTYDTEDIDDYLGILKPGQYHAVVGNPPYIAPPDKALRAVYRQMYKAIVGKYVLSIPFMELFFRLAIRGEVGQGAGYVGQITSNSFMTREYGKKLIEEFLAGKNYGNPIDLTLVVDSSGAWFPGHNFDGTPTVIVVGRRRLPVSDEVRTVLGLRGDATPLPDPSTGPVWREIADHSAEIGFEGRYVAVVQTPRVGLASHPWTLSGGGVDEVLKLLAAGNPDTVESLAYRAGFFGIVGFDDVFVVPPSYPRRHGVAEAYRPIVVGDEVRDFGIQPNEVCFFPYDKSHVLKELGSLPGAERLLWPFRADLRNRATFDGATYASGGRPWWEWHQLPRDEEAQSLAVAFAEVATHNHFVLDRDAVAFKQTAPFIKFKGDTPDTSVLGLMAVLNSSAVCFWLRHTSYPKDKTPEPWATRHQFGSTKVLATPIPGKMPVDRGRTLARLGEEAVALTPRNVIARWSEATDDDLGQLLKDAELAWAQLRQRIIFEQEELDWQVYKSYDLTDDDLSYAGSGLAEISLGERAFEIALARMIKAGEEETGWFERHNSTPIIDPPSSWPEDYKSLVQRRLACIESDRAISLLEKPEFKRRYATTGWEAQRRAALQDAVLDRLEDSTLWKDPQGPTTRSVAELADLLRADSVLKEFARALTGTSEPDLAAVIGGLIPGETVPFLAAYRYKPAGVEKYRAWQAVWALQRREDAGEKVTIPVPPKYGQGDFVKAAYWKARGKLDVPKERFISYPGVAREGDATPVLGWAGWSHRDQALALAREIPTQQALGADDATLVPLVAGLVELEPWLAQWHAEIEPQFGASPASVIAGVVDQYLARMEKTRDQVTAWTPPAATRGRKASR